MKHISVLVLILLVLWLVYSLVPWTNIRPFFNLNTTFTVSDISSIASTVISVISLFVALWSVSIAVQQLKDARDGSAEQAITLRKQQESLDRSRGVLEFANENAIKQQQVLAEGLNVSTEQLKLLTTQWQDAQEKAARKPVFDVQYRFTYYVTGGVMGTFPGIVIEQVSGGYIEEESEWIPSEINADQPFVVHLKNTFPRPEDHWGEGSFKLDIRIRNTGTITAKDLNVRVYPLVYGIRMIGDGIAAAGAMVNRLQEPLYTPATVHKSQLPIYENTKEEIVISFEVIFLKQELDKLVPVSVDMYSDGDRMINETINFKIAR